MASNTYNLNTYKAIFLAKEPTLTIGATGKTFDGTIDVSFSKDEILGTSDSTYFLRGDKTWTNILTRTDHTADIGFIVENTDATNPLKVGYIIGASGNGGIFDYTHNAWKVQIAPDGTTTFIGSLDGNATTASYPLGFSSRSTGASWGDQTGSTLTVWSESDGGGIEFRKNNPSSGKLSVKVDGRFYVAEGQVPVGGLKTDGSYWGLTSPDGDDTVWIRTTTQGILPYQSGGIGSGHSWIGHSSWFFGSAFVDHVYSHTLDLAGATDNNMSSTTSNPGIVFSESNNRTQPVFLVYTDYDSYRGPAGLKILGGSNATPAWFEVEGQIYAAGAALTGDLDLYTSSSDSPDITWWYANKGKEQARIWMGSGGTTKWAPNYRCYNSSGTSLYSGTLVCGDGTGASGTWGISISGNATTASYPQGFSSRSTGETWGNTTGTGIAAWNTSTGGSISFRNDNPSSGKLSIKVDGRFYGNEGTYPAMLQQHKNSYWGIGTPDADDTVWIRTTTQGIIPYQSGGASAGHCSLGTNTWYFASAYIQNIYGTLHGNCSNIVSVKVSLTVQNGYIRYYNTNISSTSRVFVTGCSTGSTGVVFTTEAGNGWVDMHACDTYNGKKLGWSGTINNINILIING